MSNATNRWLDKLAAADKAKGGTGTDYKCAQIVGVDPQLMYKYRRGVNQMGDGPAIKLAEALGLHPMIVIAEIRAEQSRDVRAARVWDQVAKAAKGGKIAAVILAASLQLAPAGNSAIRGAETPSPTTPGGSVPHCILCKVPSRPNPRAPRAPHPIPQLTPGRFKLLPLARAA